MKGFLGFLEEWWKQEEENENNWGKERDNFGDQNGEEEGKGVVVFLVWDEGVQKSEVYLSLIVW